MCLSEIKQFIYKNFRIIGIAVLILFFVVVSTYYIITISEEYAEVTSSPEPHTLVIPFNINLKGQTGFVETDVSVGLNLTYPTGILVVNEPVEIIGIAALLEENANNIDHISLSFQNCFAHPLNFSQWGIPEQGFINFINKPPDYAGMDYDRTTGKMIMYMRSNATVTWTNEGSHTPIIGIFYKDGSNQTMFQENSPIHVYPRTHLTEIQSTKVNIHLAVAVFIFSAFRIRSFIP